MALSGVLMRTVSISLRVSVMLLHLLAASDSNRPYLLNHGTNRQTPMNTATGQCRVQVREDPRPLHRKQMKTASFLTYGPRDWIIKNVRSWSGSMEEGFPPDLEVTPSVTVKIFPEKEMWS
jgi:hypothetical protein